MLSSLPKLPYKPFRAIIINCGTKVCSTLALMSALKYAEMPLLMIDCESKDDSLPYFESLQKNYEFELISMPLKPHGQTLNTIFKTLQSDYIVLVDSDVEILGGEVMEIMKKYIVHPNVFGAGFLHMSEWMLAKNSNDEWEKVGYYAENPYTPLCILDRNHYFNALEEGSSFEYFEVKNTKDSLLKKGYYWLLDKLIRLKPNNSLQYEINCCMNGKKEFMIAYDAGGKIYEYLRYQKRLDYVGIPHRLQDLYIKHYQGVTRYFLNPTDTNFTSNLEILKEEIEEKLWEKYEIKF